MTKHRIRSHASGHHIQHTIKLRIAGMGNFVTKSYPLHSSLSSFKVLKLATFKHSSEACRLKHCFILSIKRVCFNSKRQGPITRSCEFQSSLMDVILKDKFKKTVWNVEIRTPDASLTSLNTFLNKSRQIRSVQATGALAATWEIDIDSQKLRWGIGRAENGGDEGKWEEGRSVYQSGSYPFTSTNLSWPGFFSKSFSTASMTLIRRSSWDAGFGLLDMVALAQRQPQNTLFSVVRLRLKAQHLNLQREWASRWRESGPIGEQKRPSLSVPPCPTLSLRSYGSAIAQVTIRR